MSPSETKSEDGHIIDLPARYRAGMPRAMAKAIFRITPFLITLFATGVAVVLGWAMWNIYMGQPWTRDGTVRSYVVTMAPEIAGRIVELPVQDNEFVHKGDLLLVIDPTDYTIAVQLAEAAVRHAQASAETIDAQIAVQQAQINASEAQVDEAQAAVTFAREQAARYEDLAKREFGTLQMAQETASTLRKEEAALRNSQAAFTLAQRQIATLKAQRSSAEATIAQTVATRDQAKVNLGRTQIRSPANGWITNLRVRLGDYATVGNSVISLVDADSFWVDAYFEETQLSSIHEGASAKVKLMSFSQIVQGEVGSVARGISVSNAQSNQQGLATVNPIFTWVRLAQRIPVRIRIKELPDGVRLVAGMTATVEIEPRRSSD
jgi:multidrug resistance efflux pump